MNELAVIALVLGAGWALFFVNVWFLGRMFFSNEPEMFALRELGWPVLISLLACFLVITASIIGAWYLLAGPTRARSQRRIDQTIRRIDASWMVDLINDQIEQDRLWGDDWIKANWMSLSPEQQVGVLTENIAQLKYSVGRHLEGYYYRTDVLYMDAVAVLREVLGNASAGDRGVELVPEAQYQN